MGFEPSTFDFEVPGVSLESHWDGSDNGESLTYWYKCTHLDNRLLELNQEASDYKFCFLNTALLCSCRKCSLLFCSLKY